VALYLSTNKGEDYTTQGFELFKTFQGDKKIVVILKRQVQ